MTPAVDNWKVARLGEKAYEVRDLYEPSDKEYLPYIGLEHIEQQTLTISDIGSSADTVSTKKYFKKGDILFGSLRPYFRKVVRPRFDGVCSTDITVIRANPGTNQEFLNYFIAAPSFIAHASNISSGTRMPRANWKVLSESKWLFPPLPTQNKIASILSAYDDLIENNLKRIKILEEMAQMIYREWFVNFRFPGHEKVKMVKSELGMIPEGWEVSKIGDAFITVLGGTPSRKQNEYWQNGTIPWINSGKVNDLRIIDESEFITELGLNKSATKLMPKRTTVLAITGATLGQVSLLEIEACANQSVVGLYDNTGRYNEYIYLKIKEIIEQIISKAGGGAQQHINKEIVFLTKIIIPPKLIVDRFNMIIQAIFDLIANILFKNKTLRKTRDLLLPKLISGEIDVESVDLKLLHENN